MKKIFLSFLILCMSLHSIIIAQIRVVNNATNLSVTNSPAFIDASSNTTSNNSSNVGKGLIFPRVDLSVMTSFPSVTAGIPNSFPTRFDGMIVYNTAISGSAGVGSTEGTLSPGFWYYENKSTSLNGGTWKLLGSGAGAAGDNIYKADGTLAGNRTVIMGSKDLRFNSTDGNFLVVPSGGTGRMGVGTSTPNSSALLDLSSTDMGFLPPRMSAIQRDNIASPADGLVIYNETEQCLNYRKNNEWLSICGSSKGKVNTFACGSETTTGMLISGTASTVASGVTIVLAYSGGNGGSYGDQSVASTGVTGLTATLSGGNFNSGDGSVTYVITGTPSGTGTATFPISLGGESCNISIAVVAPGVATTFNCASAVQEGGSLTTGVAASGVTVRISYTGGNGGGYLSQSIASQGVTGLTAKLSSGLLNTGSGSVVYSIEGTPSGFGTATFPVSLGGQNCSFTVNITGTAGVTGLNCGTANIIGSVTEGSSASGVSASISYNGGNGGAYGSQLVTSTGVTGLVATLSAGSLANGSGNVIYIITGTPASSGTANFSISLGGKSCSFSIQVQPNVTSLSTGVGRIIGNTAFDVAEQNDGGSCGALSGLRTAQKADFTNPAWNTRTYNFLPQGIVANVRFAFTNTNGEVITSISGGNPATNDITSFVPVTVRFNTNLNNLAKGLSRENALTADIYAIYNVGGVDKTVKLTVRVQDCLVCWAIDDLSVWREFMCYNLGADTNVDPLTPASAIHGAKYQWGRKTPALTQSGDQMFSIAIPGWNAANSDGLSLSDTSKTLNDPCPDGFMIPSRAQWNKIMTNNFVTAVGTNWTFTSGNYTTGKKFGGALFLPAAGFRGNGDGLLYSRGKQGMYWSSSFSDNFTSSYSFYFTNDQQNMQPLVRAYGLSVRCISQ
ncbi:FISUMP domain-containing protein [Chryseobacterium cucumeris]|uniref:FISUMP domain-containing protein n=1 Tax=Chryseobacterium cucumeris TaxID=1813611 RepID=UPI0023F40BBB|nr:FISUMP domain-containing protein [Chryseobacterium cucumeris]